MQGNSKIIDQLNAALSLELAAINQYAVHAGMAGNWGYDGYRKAIDKRARQEMEHARELIDRILFLGGIPVVSELGGINIGSGVPGQLKFDLDSEMLAITEYRKAISMAGEIGDAGTRKLLERILKEEESHVSYIEAQQEQIAQMGVEQFLTTIVEG